MEYVYVSYRAFKVALIVEIPVLILLLVFLLGNLLNDSLELSRGLRYVDSTTLLIFGFVFLAICFMSYNVIAVIKCLRFKFESNYLLERSSVLLSMFNFIMVFFVIQVIIIGVLLGIYGLGVGGGGNMIFFLMVGTLLVGFILIAIANIYLHRFLRNGKKG